ncbi:dihydrolipoamide acetyltransferase family protein [Larkinella bovis]|uniref:Dihydrolipoamide acetyltransferase component of pyruvate dehydrogenase complex n=1 Tax=Larkinella bovis TaxID=683041 RepID=A0ABW0IL88_9BACT
MRDIIMPSMGENVKEGLVVAIAVKPGETVKDGQTLIEVETDKVTFEIPAEGSGEIAEILVTKGGTVAPGDVLARLTAIVNKDGEVQDVKTGSEPESPVTASVPKTVEKPEIVPAARQEVGTQRNGNKVVSTPLARKLARELAIELSELQQSVNGRISFADVKNYARNRIRQRGQQGHAPVGVYAPPLPDFERFGPVRYTEMTPTMLATSRTMTVAVSQIPHAWIQEKIDITDLENNRKKHKKQVEAAGGSLTITALLVKAVVQALRAFPLLNASVDPEKKQIISKEYYHIGVAVDTDKGLLVPVIRNADQRTVTDIARELTRISADARDRKTKPEDLEGGTFTLSNLGGIGTTGINPIVNWPQVGILGVSAGQLEPVWQDDQFVPRLRMPVTLGFDHRVINGADAARFLQYLKKITEDPFLLLL